MAQLAETSCFAAVTYLLPGPKIFSTRGCEAKFSPDGCVITAHDAVTGKELWRTRTIPKPGEPNPHVDYSETEQNVWRTVCRELWPKWEHYAIDEFNAAVAALDLPRDRVPELDEVSRRLEPLTGFRYLPAAGLVS